jgi:hypothetical protein
MRTRGLVLVVALLGAAALAAASVTKMPPTDAKKFWSYISTFNPYTKWKMWPGHEGIYPGKSPHGAYLKVYVNDLAYTAIKQKKPMPNGAVIVKENYGKDKKTLMAVTPMYKVKGYNPDAGDWFWGKYGPDGKIMASGKIAGCIKCHSMVKKHGWLFLAK